MKKVVLVLALAVFIAGGAFAQLSFSAGGGVFFDGSFGNGKQEKVGGDTINRGTNNVGFGGYVFFDAAFVEASVNFGYSAATLNWKKNGSPESLDILGITIMKDGDELGGALFLNFSILGKFPIDLGAFVIYPAIGLGYNIVLTRYDDDGKEIKEPEKYTYPDYSKEENVESNKGNQFNTLSILAGVGIDLPLSSALFLRAQALLSLRFPTYDAQREYDSMPSSYKDDTSLTLGIGPTIKVGIGFRL